MADKIYDVELVISQTVRVRVPEAVVEFDESPEDVAAEFAVTNWAEYIISKEESCDVETITEVMKQAPRP